MSYVSASSLESRCCETKGRDDGGQNLSKCANRCQSVSIINYNKNTKKLKQNKRKKNSYNSIYVIIYTGYLIISITRLELK